MSDNDFTADQPKGSVPRTPSSTAPRSSGENPADPQAHLPVEFDGTAREYFGIWIVNLLLTIVTLSVWSSWAKVRRMRYFYANTRLGSDNFEFLASGWQIFRGRIIALVIIGLLSASQFISPWAQLVTTLIFLPLFPWIVNMSLRFRARMTMWRNVRFAFKGNYWGAFGVFVAMPIAGIFTAGLLFPLAGQMAAKYVARNYRYGTASFESEPDVGKFYAAFFIAVGVMMAAGILMMIPFVTAIASAALAGDTKGGDINILLKNLGPMFFSMIFIGFLFYIVGFIIAGQVYLALTRNAIINALRLEGGHRFSSSLSGVKLAWITISNMAVVLFSLGLMQPWAATRVWNYQTSRYGVTPGAPIDAFVDEQREAVSAFGSELGDFEGFDIGFGI